MPRSSVVIAEPEEAVSVADNDNVWDAADPTPTVDPFSGDLDGWLGWLMDCVAIESSIRRR